LATTPLKRYMSTHLGHSNHGEEIDLSITTNKDHTKSALSYFPNLYQLKH